MRYSIFLLGFFILMCSGETNNTNQITPPDGDSTETAKEDSLKDDSTGTVIDSSETDTTADSTEVDEKDTTETIVGKLNRDTIYNLASCPDTTIYENQMFKYASEQFWATSDGKSGTCFDIMGKTYILRENNKNNDTIAIIITSDSLLTDTTLVIKAIIPANDSLITIVSIKDLFTGENIPVVDTLAIWGIGSQAEKTYLGSIHKNYLPSISLVTDEQISPTYYYSIYADFNYKVKVNGTDTDVLWDTIRN